MIEQSLTCSRLAHDCASVGLCIVVLVVVCCGDLGSLFSLDQAILVNVYVRFATDDRQLLLTARLIE